MAQEIRTARTNIDGAIQTTAPEQHSQIVPRAIPEFHSRLEGLSGLNDAFARFFGQVSGAISSVQEGVLLAEKKKIEQENQAQKAQAFSDFYEGKPSDPSLKNDHDYYDTYRTLLATKTGEDAANEFKQWYAEKWLPENPTGDLTATREQWIKDHLGGADDPIFAAQSMDQFVKSTDKLVSDQTENAVRVHIAQGKQNLAAAIAADAKNGEITPDRLAFYIESYRKLDPLNPQDAAPAVASQLNIAIETNPDKAQAILGVLDKPGTGINGKSFAESFPEAYAEAQDKAVKTWQSTNSMDAWTAIDGLKRRADNFYKMSDADLNQFGADLIVTRNKYGAAASIDSLQSQLATEYEKRAKTKATVDQFDTMRVGGIPLDPEAAKKAMPAWFAAHGIDNILKADPVMVADTFVRMGGASSLPDEYKAQLGNALTSFENPQAQMAAVSILDAVQKQRDVKFATSMLNDDAARYYNAVAADMNMTGASAKDALDRANTLRRNTQGKDLTWSDVMPGVKPADVQKNVDSSIQKSFDKVLGTGGWFQGSVSIPPALKQQVEDYALSVVATRGLQGVSTSDAIDEAVQRMSARTELIPGPGGQYVLSFDTDRPDAYQGADGKLTPRVRLGTEVPNPITGKTENTVATYEQDLSALRQSQSSVVLPHGTDQGVSLNPFPDTLASGAGAYRVLQGGRDIVYEPGQTYTVTTNEPTIVSTAKGPARGTKQVDKTVSIPPVSPSYVDGSPDGLVSPGNLDLANRPVVRNGDGSISTVRSITITQDGKAVLLPTVVGNKVVSNDEAVQHYLQTGENLGVFDTEAHADAYAKSLHNSQASLYASSHVATMRDAFPDMPDGFGFLTVPLPNGKSGYMLVYRPHFSPGMGIDQREQGWQQPTIPLADPERGRYVR